MAVMVIPVHDENPVHRRPVVTWLFLLVNVVIFLTGPVVAGALGAAGPDQLCGQDAYYRHWGAIPEELLSSEQLPVTTTGEGREVPGGVACASERPDYTKVPEVSVLTAMFLHGGWLHLLGNMLFLWVFGNNIEDRLGRLRFAAFYIGCGYVATYAYAVLNVGSQETLVGASGAIAGVLGAYLVRFPRAKVTSLVPFLLFLPVRLPAWLVLGMWFVIQWLYAQGTGLAASADVAYVAHVAGFAAGFALALLGLGRRPPPPAQPGSPYDPYVPHDPYRR